MATTEASSLLRLAVLGNEHTLTLISQIEKRLGGIELPVLKFSRTDELAARLDDFDAVAVLSSGSHMEIQSVVESLAQNGKHLLLEAAIAKTIEMVTDLSSVFRSSSASLIASFGLQFEPALKAIHVSLANGNLGQPGLLRIHSWNPRQPIDEHLPSLIGLTCWMFQSSPSIVRASRQTFGMSSQCVNLHLGFPNGGMALIDLSTLDSAEPEYLTVSVIGSTGAAYVDDHHNMQVQFRDEQSLALQSKDTALRLLSQVQCFIDSISNNQEPGIDVSDAMRAIEVSVKAVQSMKSQAAVD